MLWEAWQYLTTPCPRHLRKMGYLREFIGIASRHGRLSKAWLPHLEQSRRFIVECAERCSGRSHAVVLGSGWLLDVPWRELARQFARVSLVDVIHPRAVRRQVRACPNVELVTMDLTGVVRALFVAGSLREGSLPTPPLLGLDPFRPLDYLVSANVLSQLALLPLEFLEKRGHAADPQPLAHSILHQHLERLRSAGCPACLVTDVESRTYDRREEITERRDLLHGLTLPPPQREWIWQLAPFGEADAQHRTEHRVVGIAFPVTTRSPIPTREEHGPHGAQ